MPKHRGRARASAKDKSARKSRSTGGLEAELKWVRTFWKNYQPS